MIAALSTDEGKLEFKCTCKATMAKHRPVTPHPCNKGLFGGGDKEAVDDIMEQRESILSKKSMEVGQIIFDELKHAYSHTYDADGTRVSNSSWFDYKIHGRSVCQPVFSSPWHWV